MKLKLIPIGALVVVMGLAGYAMLRGDEYRLAKLAPANTTILLEAQDLRGTLDAFKQTDAYSDFKDSKTGEQVAKAWKQMVEAVEGGQAAGWNELGMPFNEEILLDLIGNNVAVGAIAQGETDPTMFVMTKLDLIALAREAAIEGDWTQLWERFRKGIGGEQVTGEEYKGYQIATRPGPVGELHFAMLQDTIVFSHDKQTVKQVVDVHIGAAPSLASQDAYDREVDALPRDKTAYAWVDMAFVRDTQRVKKTVDQVAALMGKDGEPLKAFKGDELKVLIDDLRELEGFALAARLPKGDPYQAEVAASRSAEATFKDTTRHDLRELVSADTVVYFEARGLYDVIEGFIQSDTLQTVADTEAAQWLKNKLENPEQLKDLAGPGAPVALDKNATFEARLGLAILRQPLRELLGNDVAVAIEARDAKEITQAVRPLAFVRTRPLLRVIGDLFTGAVATHSGEIPALSVSPYGEGQIYTFKEGPVEVHWTRVGAELAVSAQKDLVERVIDRAAGKDVGVDLQNSDFNEAITRLPADYKVFAYVNMAGYEKLIGHALEMGPPQPEEAKKAMQLTKGMVDSMAFAGYVSTDYTTWTVRTSQEYGENAPDELKKLYRNSDGDPAVWGQLPEHTFGSFTVETDPQAAFTYMKGLAGSVFGEEQVSKGLATASEQLLGGREVEKDLIAHLGASHGFALTTQERQAIEGMPPEAAKNLIAVPAGVAVLQVKNVDAFGQTFVALAKTLLEQANTKAAAGDTGAVVASLNAIASAQAMFKQTDQSGSFGSISDLAIAGLLDPELGSGFAHGHIFRVHVSSNDSQGRWMATASPLEQAEGALHFAVNQEGAVRYGWQAIQVKDDCTIPEGTAICEEGNLPKPKVGQEITDKWRLEEAEIGGRKAYRIGAPEQSARQWQGMLGAGFSPCFTVADGYCVVATSEAALAAAFEGGMTNSSDFQRVIAQRPRELAAFSHFSVSGLIDQVGHNAEMIATQAAPGPDSMKAPVAPEFPMDSKPDAFQEAMKEFEAAQKRYQEERMAHQQKLSKWRQDNAEANAKELMRILDSAKVLGDGVAFSLVKEDGQVIESTSAWQLDLKAAKN